MDDVDSVAVAPAKISGSKRLEKIADVAAQHQVGKIVKRRRVSVDDDERGAVALGGERKARRGVDDERRADRHGLALNIEASDTWNFYQAKTIRQTVLRASLESAKLANPTPNVDVQKQFSAWQANIDRLESEPEKAEGRKELLAKAKEIEHRRDEAFEKYHAYEVASLIIQLGIVLASVALLSSAIIFAYAAGALGVLGFAVLVSAYVKFGPVMHLLH